MHQMPEGLVSTWIHWGPLILRESEHESDVASRWYPRKFNSVFTSSRGKDHRKILILSSLGVHCGRPSWRHCTTNVVLPWPDIANELNIILHSILWEQTRQSPRSDAGSGFFRSSSSRRSSSSIISTSSSIMSFADSAHTFAVFSSTTGAANEE